MKKITSIIMLTVCLTTAFSFFGCEKTPAPQPTAGTVQVPVSRLTLNGAETSSKTYIGDVGTAIDLYFEGGAYINGILIDEENDTLEQYAIYDCSGEEKVLLCREEYLIKQHYCAFERKQYSHLRIEAEKASGTFEFTKLTVYDTQTDAPFRVTAYVVADTLQTEAQLDLGHFATITDVILFGASDFNKNGDLIINQPVLDNSLSLLRSAEQQLGKKFNIYLNFLFDARGSYSGSWESQMAAMAKDILNAMEKNEQKFISNLVAATQDYDGIAFDWEFPLKRSEFNAFGNFITKLKAASGKKIALALPPWGIKFSAEHIKQIDVVELMSYDLADDKGNHSNFYNQCIEAIQYAVDRGFDKKQIDLGLPFYARPSDMAGIWTSYRDEAAQLGKYGNKATGEFAGTDVPRYYNGYQMIYDKVAYGRLSGIGGVMIWHYNCDLPSASELSLFGAIGNGVKTTKAE